MEVDGLENSRALIDNAEWVALVGNGHSASHLVKWVFDNLGETVSHSAMKRAARACRRQPGYVGLPAPITGIGIPCIGVEQETSTRPECASQQRIVETVEDNGNSRIITIPKTQICTLQGVIEYCNIDTSTWDIPRHIINKWDMGYKTEEGADALPLFQVKVWLEKKVEVVAVKAEIEALIEWGASQMPHFPSIIRDCKAKPHLLEIAVPDLHMGKLAWAPETGESYDVNIAEALFWEALEDLIYKARGYDIDKILFPIGNDLLHTDNAQGQTTAGTQVESDGRYHRTFGRTRAMICSAIERLREIAPVVAPVISGNHDRLGAYHIGDSVNMYFRHADDVVIYNDPTLRKAVEYGNNLIAFTHGSEEPLKDLSKVIAGDCRKAWGRTKFHECHLGHLHKDAEQSDHGFRLRWLPSLCGADSWHKARGYKSLRQAFALCYDREKGYTGSHVFTVINSEDDIEHVMDIG